MTKESETKAVIDFIDQGRIEKMGVAEKSRKILDSVSQNNVVVLEENLSPEEQGKLTEQAMQRINEEFSGIEIKTYDRKKQQKSGGLLSRFVSKDKSSAKSNITIIGPADRMDTIEETDMFRTVISG